MADLADPKRALRRAMRRMRGRLSPEELGAAAEAVVPHVLGMDLHPGPALLYVSIRRELPTEPLFRALWAAGVSTAVPAMVGDRMESRLRRPDDLLEPDDSGIPTSHGEVVVPTVVLCPGLAFDLRGGRLGYGGGNYDRWIEDQPRRPYLVGLCVDEALVDAVPIAPHDVPMDAILTPRRGLVRVPAPTSGRRAGR